MSAKFFQISPIPSEKDPGWKALVNGEEVVLRHLLLESRFGRLEYGQRPEGYDAWAFREAGGGGAVTVPYCYDTNGELLVGLLLEKRANMGPKPCWCVIGGFVDPGEAHEEAQARETQEETGLQTAKAKELGGKTTNANRAFFVADASQGEGVRAYASKLPFEWLEKDEEGYKLSKSASFDHKKAEAVRFFPWREAVKKSPDALARAAIAQLLATLL